MDFWLAALLIVVEMGWLGALLLLGLTAAGMI
jgi:hypothetical protein